MRGRERRENIRRKCGRPRRKYGAAKWKMKEYKGHCTV
jgi:hypothetical protein